MRTRPDQKIEVLFHYKCKKCGRHYRSIRTMLKHLYQSHNERSVRLKDMCINTTQNITFVEPPIRVNMKTSDLRRCSYYGVFVGDGKMWIRRENLRDEVLETGSFIT